MKGFIFLIGSFLLISCAALPAIRPVPNLAEKNIICPSPFLTGKIRLIHAIEVRAAGQVQTVMIGVTMMDPVTRTISCALMSAEGVALFEAVSGPDGLKVSRALPPFDAANFAQKMMDDIDLIFLAPRGTLTEKGIFATGETVCRRHKELGGWIDVWQGHDGTIHICRYSEGGRLQRSVTLAGGLANPYSTINFQASERVDYSLMMTLIESEAVRDEPQRKE